MAPAARVARQDIKPEKQKKAPPKKKTGVKKQLKTCAAGQKMNGLKDKEEKTKSRRRKTLHYGSVPVYILQQTHGGSGLKAALHPNARLD
jgi:hypothetical protein